MAKVKVLVLYPTGFLGLGVEAVGSEIVELDEADAKTVVGAGWAELVEPKSSQRGEKRKTETADVKLSGGK